MWDMGSGVCGVENDQWGKGHRDAICMCCNVCHAYITFAAYRKGISLVYCTCDS